MFLRAPCRKSACTPPDCCAMPATATHSNPARSTHPNAERRGRIYLFAVTSLAVFLVAAAVGVPPWEDQPVRARIVCGKVDGQRQSEAWRSKVQKALLSPNRLAHAVIAAHADAKPQEVDEGVGHFSHELVVASEPAGFAGGGQLTIAYMGSRPTGAAVVNALVQQYVEANSVRVEAHAHEACDRARQAAEDARDRTAQAERRRDAFREEHARTLDATLSPAADTDTQPASYETAGGPAPGTVENPAWIDLRDQLSWMTAYYADLLRESGVSHPTVQSLHSRMAGLREQFERTPRWLTADEIDRSPDAEPPRDAAATRQHSTVDAKTPLQIVLAYDRLQQEYRLVRQTEQESLAQAERARQELAGAIAGRMHVASWAARPSRDRVRGFAATTLAMVLGLVCGGLLVFRRVAKDPVLRTVEDVKASLPVPMIGFVGVSGSPPASQVRPLSLSARLVERLSQSTLVVLLFCVVLLVIAEDGFLGQLAAHPLSLLSGGIRGIPSLLAG